jgi:hypothetical protein
MSLRRVGNRRKINKKKEHSESDIKEESSDMKEESSSSEDDDDGEILEETPIIVEENIVLEKNKVLKESRNVRLEEIQQQQDKELDKCVDFGKIVLDKFYICVTCCLHYTYYTIKFIIKISGVYLMWIVLHYCASHLYIQFCVPKTPIGFLLSPFMSATPHCQGLRWIVYNAANVINNMWVVLGAWICSTILIMNRESGHQDGL